MVSKINSCCVIGAGRWGKNHIRTAHSIGALGGVIEANADALNSVKEQYPDCQLFSSLKDNGALDFDAYTVAVPAEYHFEIAKTLLEHKKHVLVEKPITLTTADAEELNQLAEKNGCILMVGHLLLFHPAIRKLKEMINKGTLGKLQYIYSNRLNLGTVRTEENSLWSFAPHDISIFQYLTDSSPSAINAEGGAFLQPHIHDTSLTTLRYPNNVVGHIFVSWLHPFKEHRIVVIGSKGMVSFEDSSASKELLFYEKGIDWVNGEPVKRDGPTNKVTYENHQPLTEEFLHFFRCINGEEENSLINGEKGLDVLKVLEDANKKMAGLVYG